jgi:hypothetical protein
MSMAQPVWGAPPPRKRSTVKIVLVVVGAFGALGCCVSCVGIFLYGSDQAAQEAAPFTALVNVCAGQGVPGAAAVGAAGGPVRAQLVRDGRIVAYVVPAEQRSSSLAETELVVCDSDAERYLVERCVYETGVVTGALGGENVLERYGYRREVRVVAAQSGVELARRTFEGEPPEPCPDESHFRRGGSTLTNVGEPPEDADVFAWLPEVRAGAH